MCLLCTNKTFVDSIPKQHKLSRHNMARFARMKTHYRYLLNLNKVRGILMFMCGNIQTVYLLSISTIYFTIVFYSYNIETSKIKKLFS